MYLSALITSTYILLTTLTGNFNIDLKSLKNCNILNTLIAQGFHSSNSLNQYQVKLRETLIPWYLKNCRTTFKEDTKYSLPT